MAHVFRRPYIWYPRPGGLGTLTVQPTRLYFPSTGAAAVSPAYTSDWEDTSIASRLRCVTTKIASAMTTVSFSDADSTDRDILFRQYVSDPLNGAQTVGGCQIQLQVRANETLDTQDLFLTWVVKVMSNDGTTLRGTVQAIRRDGTELATSITNRSDVVNSTAVSASDGDRIVIELGVGGDPLVSHIADMSIGDDNATDLPIDDSTTTALNPWIEFSQNLSFQSVSTGFIRRLLMLGIGA